MSAALATEGLGWLMLTVVVAGVVRGFTGFGSALVYLPIAAMFLPPIWVIASMTGFSILGTLPLVPRALRDADKAELLRMGAAAWIGVPIGLYFLAGLAPDSFRWLVAILSLVTLLVLASGWRYGGEVPPALSAGAGFLGGFLAGFVGIGGPPVILLYLGSRRHVARIRAVILLYLVVLNIGVVTILLLRDLIPFQAFSIGLWLGPAYLLGALLGQRLFDPRRERLFRAAAYAIILLAMLTGLPVFD